MEIYDTSEMVKRCRSINTHVNVPTCLNENLTFLGLKGAKQR